MKNPRAILWYSLVGHALVAAILLKVMTLPMPKATLQGATIDIVMVEIAAATNAPASLQSEQPFSPPPAVSPDNPTPKRTPSARNPIALGHRDLTSLGHRDLPPAAGNGVGSVANPGSATGPASGSPHGDTVLTRILARLQRVRQYPREARRQQLTGSPKVEFRIQPDGSLAYVKVVQSSGSAILDAAAIRTVHRSTPLPYYANAIAIPIRFELH